MPPPAMLEVVDLLDAGRPEHVAQAARRFDRELSRIDSLLLWLHFVQLFQDVTEPREPDEGGEVPLELIETIVRDGAERSLEEQKTSGFALRPLLSQIDSLARLLEECRPRALAADKQALREPRSCNDQRPYVLLDLHEHGEHQAAQLDREGWLRFRSPLAERVNPDQRQVYWNALEAAECLADWDHGASPPSSAGEGEGLTGLALGHVHPRALMKHAPGDADDWSFAAGCGEQLAFHAVTPDGFGTELDRMAIHAVPPEASSHATPSRVVLTPDPRVMERLRQQVSEALFPLLAELGIVLKPADESRLGTELLGRLAGPATVERFRALHAWLAEYRRQPPNSRIARRVRWLFPGLFEEFAGVYRPLSFRLFLRIRLHDFCVVHGLRPESQSLETAVALLTRERMGALLQQALEQLSTLAGPEWPAWTKHSLAETRERLAADVA